MGVLDIYGRVKIVEEGMCFRHSSRYKNVEEWCGLDIPDMPLVEITLQRKRCSKIRL